MKRGDLVYEEPYPERGIVIKILKGGMWKSYAPMGASQRFQKNTQINWWW